MALAAIRREINLVVIKVFVALALQLRNLGHFSREPRNRQASAQDAKGADRVAC